MPLPKDFAEQLSSKTDAELYDVLDHQGDWLPEAVAAAKDELNKRNLTPERVAQIESAAEAQKTAAEARAQEHLGWPMRFFLFFFFAGLFGALLAVYYGQKGYKQKAADCWVTMLASVVFYLIIGLLWAVVG